MFLRDSGLAWERTEKIDANHDLVREFQHLDQDELSWRTGQLDPAQRAVLDGEQSSR